MFKVIKDFFVKETEWGFPFKKKASKFSQWYACILVFIGSYKLCEWIALGISDLIDEIDDRRYSKIKKEVMGEIETE